jgi:hypothetical protein
MKNMLFVLLMGIAFTAHSQEQKKKKQPHDLPAKRKTLLSPIANFNAPLYLQDDKPITEETLAKINVDDIDSITILKDSASTKTYGEKGQRGVVLIAMKKRKTDND